MISGASVSPDKNRDVPHIHPESGVPQSLIISAMVVGLALILIGLGFIFIGRAPLLASLLTCVGFGLVLASFGTKAGGIWAGYTVTGAGAIAIVLFLLLQAYTPPPPNHKRGQLRGDFSLVADLRIVDGDPLYAYRDKTTNTVQFIFLDREPKTDTMSIIVDTNEDGPGKEFFLMIGDSKKIYDHYLSDELDRRRHVHWAFDYPQRIVRGRNNEILFSEPLNIAQAPKSDAYRSWFRSTTRDLLSGVSSAEILPIRHAYAGGLPTLSGVESSEEEIDSLINALTHDVPTVRRNARDLLAAGVADATSSVVPRMVSALKREPPNYRIKLGVVYALAEALRRDVTKRTEISAHLADDDFPLLVAIASHDDKTLRFQAAQFLALLGDRRAIPASSEAARATTDDNKAINQVIITRQSTQSLPASERKDVFKNVTVKGQAGGNNSVVRSPGYLQKLFNLK